MLKISIQKICDDSELFFFKNYFILLINFFPPLIITGNVADSKELFAVMECEDILVSFVTTFSFG